MVDGVGERDRVTDPGLPDAYPSDHRFHRVTRLARKAFGVPAVVIAVHDAAHVRAVTDHLRGDAAHLPPGSTVVEPVMEECDLVVAQDTALHERLKDEPWVTGAPWVRFYAGVPLIGPEERPAGALVLLDVNPRAFDEEDRATLCDLGRMLEKQLAVDAELRRAGQVQAGLLPQRAPALDGYQLAGRCVPAREVGGDFFDWQVVPSGVSFTLADVMGKGMPAAIVAATVRAVLRASGRGLHVVHAIADAEAALEGDLLESSTFATAFHATLDLGSGAVTYSDAGHGLTLVLRADGTVERLSPGGPPLGLSELGTREAGVVHLGAGDTILAVSDGVIDALDGTLQSLDVVGERARGARSADEVVARVLDLTGPADQLSDDVTVVALRREAA
jgi:hypothetical protein